MRFIYGQPLSEFARLALERLGKLKENVDSIAISGRGVSMFPRPAVPAMGGPMPALQLEHCSDVSSRVVLQRAWNCHQRKDTFDVPQFAHTNRKPG